MNDLIKTEEENKVVLSLIERLMDADPQKDSEEGKLLAALTIACQAFETKTYV